MRRDNGFQLAMANVIHTETVRGRYHIAENANEVLINEYKIETMGRNGNSKMNPSVIMTDPWIPATVQRLIPRLVRDGEHETHHEESDDDDPTQPRERQQTSDQLARGIYAARDIPP